MQAQAMVEIVKQLGWSYVSTVAAQVHPQLTLCSKSEKIYEGRVWRKRDFIIHSACNQIWDMYWSVCYHQ